MSILKKNKNVKNIINFSNIYFSKLSKIFSKIDLKKIQQLENELLDLKKKTKVKETFKKISLNDNSSVLTAIANDVGYENIFLNQLKIHFKKNDKILIFSASGNSENLVKAAKWIRKRRGRVISILGFDGGKIKKLSNCCVHIKTEKGEYGPVEDLQLIINHILAHWFQVKFN